MGSRGRRGSEGARKEELSLKSIGGWTPLLKYVVSQSLWSLSSLPSSPMLDSGRCPSLAKDGPALFAFCSRSVCESGTTFCLTSGYSYLFIYSDFFLCSDRWRIQGSGGRGKGDRLRPIYLRYFFQQVAFSCTKRIYSSLYAFAINDDGALCIVFSPRFKISGSATGIDTQRCFDSIFLLQCQRYCDRRASYITGHRRVKCFEIMGFRVQLLMRIS